MSDGDNATPGRRRAPDENGADQDGANEWLTRSPLPPRAAAPWERGTAAEPRKDDPDPATGSHTDGVTVADLIAKITGAPADRPSRHAAPEPEPPPRPATPPRAAPPRSSTSPPRATPPPRAATPPPASPPPASPRAEAAEATAAQTAAREPLRPRHRGHPEGLLRRRDSRPGRAAAGTPRARRSRAGRRPGRRSAERRRRTGSRIAASCWPAAPWPPSSPCSRWR